MKAFYCVMIALAFVLVACLAFMSGNIDGRMRGEPEWIDCSRRIAQLEADLQQVQNHVGRALEKLYPRVCSLEKSCCKPAKGCCCKPGKPCDCGDHHLRERLHQLERAVVHIERFLMKAFPGTEEKKAPRPKPPAQTKPPKEEANPPCRH